MEDLTRAKGLTRTEHQVASLATKGLTNKQIARELYVTIKAVEWHLSSIYRKIGIAGRGELLEALSTDPSEAKAGTIPEWVPPQKITNTMLYQRVRDLERQMARLVRLFEGLHMGSIETLESRTVGGPYEAQHSEALDSETA